MFCVIWPIAWHFFKFKERFVDPIDRGRRKHVFEKERQFGSKMTKEGNADSTNLPKKNEMVVWLRLTAFQEKLYKVFVRGMTVKFSFRGQRFPTMMIMQKICNHPFLLTERDAEDMLKGMASEDSDSYRQLQELIADGAAKTYIKQKHDNISCKISFIISLLDNLIVEGHKVLIFSQTRMMLNVLEHSFEDNDFKFLRIDDETKPEQMQVLIKQFQNSKAAPPIFLLTSKVGGLGLTLTKADRVIMVDPAWNPSIDSQSVDSKRKHMEDRYPSMCWRKQ